MVLIEKNWFGSGSFCNLTPRFKSGTGFKRIPELKFINKAEINSRNSQFIFGLDGQADKHLKQLMVLNNRLLLILKEEVEVLFLFLLAVQFRFLVPEFDFTSSFSLVFFLL